MDIELFAEKLIIAICNELQFWKHRLSFETMRAFSINVIPYEGYLGLCFLTPNEDFDEAEIGKWALADWRWYSFTETHNSIWQQVEELELLDWMVERVEATEDQNEFVLACEKAITSEQVRAKLKQYNLAEDFELSVYLGDGGAGSENRIIPWQ